MGTALPKSRGCLLSGASLPAIHQSPLRQLLPPGSARQEHNSPGYAPRVPGQCGRPGCQNPVTKASDGTESTYCSSECVVGQCREVYTSWSSHHNHNQPNQQPV